MIRSNHNVPLWLGTTLLAGLLLLLVLPLIVGLKDPDAISVATRVGERVVKAPYAPGQLGYVLGSDWAGRDVLSRVVYGARITLLIAVVVTSLRAALAIPAGLLAGWYGGLAARVISALSTGTSALPSIVLATLILGGIQKAVPESGWLWTYCGVMVLIGTPRLAEQVRRLTEETARRQHIEAAVALGAPPRRIILKHIFPLMNGELAVSLAAEMAWALVMMGQLAIFNIWVGGYVAVELIDSVLRLEKFPEWGQMMGANRDLLRTGQWWIPVAPGVALGATVVGLQLLAEGLRLRTARH